ncbi:MAG: alpha-amylase family glycosyl hydrolase, partial [bacterium]
MLQNSLEHHTHKKLSRGESIPLGATLQEDGINFALFSRYAHDVFLLLFDSPKGNPTDVIKLNKDAEHVWRIFIHGLKAGQLYGYKVRGDYNPAQGMRFNEHKLLIDPYARALTGKFQNRDNLLTGYDSSSSDKDLVIDSRDNAHCVPKSIVIDDRFDWQEDKHPNIPLNALIIYEAHLKGFTAHPSSHAQQRGTYLGFIEKIPYLKDLGINTVELLPIHESYTHEYLIKKGLSEYWGYNTIGFFAPESSYSSQKSPGCQVNEFKMLVRELHKAGIEIILDVVYNHTGEGDETGPTLSLRGIDNPTYYALEGPSIEPYRHYLNVSGCGNILNGENPVV